MPARPTRRPPFSAWGFSLLGRPRLHNEPDVGQFGLHLDANNRLEPDGHLQHLEQLMDQLGPRSFVGPASIGRRVALEILGRIIMVINTLLGNPLYFNFILA